MVGLFGYARTMPALPLLNITESNIRIQGVKAGSKTQLEELFKLWLEKKVRSVLWQSSGVVHYVHLLIPHLVSEVGCPHTIPSIVLCSKTWDPLFGE